MKYTDNIWYEYLNIRPVPLMQRQGKVMNRGELYSDGSVDVMRDTCFSFADFTRHDVRVASHEIAKKCNTALERRKK